MSSSSLLLFSVSTILPFLFLPVVKASTGAVAIDRQFHVFPILIFGLTVLHGLALFFALLSAAILAVVALFEAFAFKLHLNAGDFGANSTYFAGFEMAAILLLLLLTFCGLAAHIHCSRRPDRGFPHRQSGKRPPRGV